MVSDLVVFAEIWECSKNNYPSVTCLLSQTGTIDKTKEGNGHQGGGVIKLLSFPAKSMRAGYIITSLAFRMGLEQRWGSRWVDDLDEGPEK